MNPHALDRVHRIEFRWRPGRDFGPIASSPSNDRFIEDCGSMLTKIAVPPAGVAHGHRSVAYLDFSQRGFAAVIERSFDEYAPSIDRGHSPEDGGRRPLVAHAIVGPPDVVGVDFALACARQGMTGLGLGLKPGHVPPGAPLGTLDAAELGQVTAEAVRAADDLPRSPRGLHAVIAATLRRPSRPVAVLIPGADRQLSEVESYLRGLRYTAMILLSETDARWRPSFSTFEPPAGRATAYLPHLVFRDIDPMGSAPPTEVREETRVSPYDAPEGGPGMDEHDRVALCLAGAYARMGREGIIAILRPLADRHPSLDGRLNAVLDDGNLAEFLPRTAATAAPAGPPTGRLPVANKVAPRSTSPLTGPSPMSSAPATAAVPRPRQAAPRPPYPAGAPLSDLYGELDARRGKSGFFEVVELIGAYAGHGIILSAEESDLVIGRLNQSHWYTAELDQRYGERAVERLSGLMHPLFAGRFDDPMFLGRLRKRVADPTTPTTWVRAITLLYAKLVHHPGAAALGAELAAALLERPDAAGRTPPDMWPPREPDTPVRDETMDAPSVLAWASQPVSVPAWVLVAAAAIVTLALLLAKG